MAQCCHPHYPDSIVAVLRTGNKCMIHSAFCRGLERANPRRILSAYWQMGEKGKVVSFSLLFHDVAGLLTRVTRVFYEMGINIVDLSVKAQKDSTCRIQVHIEIPLDDPSFLDRLLARIHIHIPEFLTREDDFLTRTNNYYTSAVHFSAQS